MELKPGYKQTEVGVIPEDWESLKVKDLVEREYIDKPLDGNHGNIHPKKSDFVDYGVPFVMANDIKDGKIDFANCSFITIKQANTLQKGFSVTGDVLLTHKGTVGNTAIVEKISTPFIMLTPQVTYYRVISREHIDNRYLRHYFDGYKFQTILKNYSGGGTRAYIGITKQADLPIVLPPSKFEQTAIANALSDADALIQSLTRLIAKKHQIKQGAMQTLLNPYENGRLKAEWDESPLREISYMKGRIGWQGLKQTEFTMNEEEPFLITGMNFKDGEIRWNEVYHISYERYEIAKDIQLKPNDVLMTKDGTIGKLLYVNDIPYPGKASLNSHLLVFRPMRNSYDPRFLYYQLSSKVFRDYIEISKSGSTFFGLSQEAVGNYLFKFPKPEEQTRIATILSGMDAEITALETKLAKYRHIKQGMMQNLLTGRIRLVKPESNTGAAA